MLNVLVAYPYWTPRIAALLETFPHRLIVDSGAWTAHNSGKEITLDGYCRFLDSLRGEFRAVQLDVIGDGNKSWANYQTMKARGYDVMPVFTRGERIERLDEMYETTDYALFGGIVGGGNDAYLRFVMEHNRGRKIHWLGFTQTDFIKHYRPTSVDSSSWVPGRFGSCSYYVGGGVLKTLCKPQAAKKPPREFFDACVRVGAEPWMPWAMAKEDAWRGNGNGKPFTAENPKGMVALLSAMAHLARAKDIEAKLGTRVYFAIPTAAWLELLLTAARRRGDV